MQIHYQSEQFPPLCIARSLPFRPVVETGSTCAFTLQRMIGEAAQGCTQNHVEMPNGSGFRLTLRLLFAGATSIVKLASMD